MSILQNAGSLAIIQQALQFTTRYTLSITSWLSEETARAQQVAVYRRYTNGLPDNFLTAGQRTLLNLPTNGRIHEFSDNYCPVVINTTLDRIDLTTIEADTDEQQTWIDDVLHYNRMDELQVNLHEAALRDGNAFLLVDAIEDSDKKRRIRLTQEPAYDGFFGMVVMYETAASKTASLAAKVWRITTKDSADTVRLNMYYPNRIERFIGFIGGGLRKYGIDAPPTVSGATSAPLSVDPELAPGYPPTPDDNEPSVIPWTMDGTLEGEPIGVPVIHFRNRGNNITTHGISELENVIPLQDLLNRTLYDMAATSALSAFGVRVMIGAEAPTAISPGMMLSYFAQSENTDVQGIPTPAAIEWLKTIRLDQFQQADLVPYIGQLEWLKNEIFAVTNTPENENASASASGESLRQREVKLIGKVKRFETRNGNSWEDTLLMCARVQQAFVPTDKPPVLDVLNAKWADPEIRNDSETQADALSLYQAGLIDQRTTLEMLAPIYDWDTIDLDRIVAETMKAAGMNQIGANDAQDVMTRLQQAQQNGGQAPPAKPMMQPPGQPKVTANGMQTTPGA